MKAVIIQTHNTKVALRVMTFKGADSGATYAITTISIAPISKSKEKNHY